MRLRDRYERVTVPAIGTTTVVGCLSVLLLCATPPTASASPLRELFTVGSPTAPFHSQTWPSARRVALAHDLQASLVGDEYALSIPGEPGLIVVHDRSEIHPSGNQSWIGHLRDLGTDYRIVITHGRDGVVGRVLTRRGELRLVSDDAGSVWLIDPAEEDLRPLPPSRDDAVIPPVSGPARNGTDGEAAAAPGSTVTIDVLVLYTPGMESGAGGGVQTRLDHLVALTNQAYIDSQVAIRVRLVHTQKVTYSEGSSNLDALGALYAGGDTTSPSFDPALAQAGTLRLQYGADLVALIRPFDFARHTDCGRGYLNGFGGNDISQYAATGYSVVSDGQDVAGSGYYCTEYTFAHELGHNMGSAHDRENATGAGAYPYSYGYGVAGRFGTIMSYLSPQIGKFSNPDLRSCDGGPCGVPLDSPNSANNALSLNNTRAAVAGFAQTQIPEPCVASNDTLCLQGGRFRVQATWRDFGAGGGAAGVVAQKTSDSGLLYFYNPTNWEILVKVIDACGMGGNGHYWVFGAAATTLNFDLDVTDTTTGAKRRYSNVLGHPAGSITDVLAFDGCP